MWFFTNFFNGIGTANEVRKLVLKDKRLLVYPVVMAIVAGLLAIIIGFVSIVTTGELAAVASSTNSNAALIPIVITAFVIYVVVYFVASYFTTAMLIAFRSFTKGKQMSFNDALGHANSYISLLLQWAVFFAVITVIVDLIEAAIRAALRRYGIAGNFISSMITGIASMALGLVAMFSMPVIIDNRTGPVATIKASGKFIIKNFGQTFGGLIYSDIVQYLMSAVGAVLIFAGFLLSPLSAGFGVIGLLMAFLIILLLSMSEVGALIVFAGAIIGALVAPQAMGFAAVALVAVAFAIITLGFLLKYVLFACFTLIIYDYKARGTVPKGFDKDLVDSAVKNNPKQQLGAGAGGMLGGLGGMFGGGSSGSNSGNI